MTMRYRLDQALAAHGAPEGAQHIGFCPGFVDKNQLARIELQRGLAPFIARLRNIWPGLFSRV
jgi:hypothetical protein